jgi:hypothetical protein
MLVHVGDMIGLEGVLAPESIVPVKKGVNSVWQVQGCPRGFKGSLGLRTNVWVPFNKAVNPVVTNNRSSSLGSQNTLGYLGNLPSKAGLANHFIVFNKPNQEGFTRWAQKLVVFLGLLTVNASTEPAGEG